MNKWIERIWGDCKAPAFSAEAYLELIHKFKGQCYTDTITFPPGLTREERRNHIQDKLRSTNEN